jgi:hypothetical protein
MCWIVALAPKPLAFPSVFVASLHPTRPRSKPAAHIFTSKLTGSVKLSRNMAPANGDVLPRDGDDGPGTIADKIGEHNNYNINR